MTAVQILHSFDKYSWSASYVLGTLGLRVQECKNTVISWAYHQVSNFPTKSIVTGCGKCSAGEGQAVMRASARRLWAG